MNPQDPEDLTDGAASTRRGGETMAFGRGGGIEESTELPTDSSQPAPDKVDAWYTEPGPDVDVDQRDPSWLSTKWASWKSLDRDRRTIAVLLAVAVIAVLVALLGVTSRDDETAIELPAVESHGLEPDEAACFAFGLIEKRFEVRLGPEGFDTSDPSEVTGTLTQELQALDDLAADHPEADYRLITAFAALADANTVLADSDGFADFRSSVSERADAVQAAADACDEVAEFDVAELEPRS